MARTTTSHTVTLHGITGTGRTRTDAKADADAQLALALAGDYTPLVLRFPLGHIGIVSRLTPTRAACEWEYTILWPDASDSRGCCAQAGYPTRAAAERALRSHVAHCLIFCTDDDGMSVILDTQDQQTHARYVAWQQRYRRLQDAGYAETQCHALASSEQTTADAIAARHQPAA